MWFRVVIAIAVITSATVVPSVEPFVPAVQAATVVAPNGDPDGICTQTVSTTSGVAVAKSGETCVITFSHPWSLSNTWTVPADVSIFSFVVTASAGGSGVAGDGGRVSGTLDLSSVNSPTIYLHRGSARSAADIRLGSNSLQDRVVVAGAGGACGLDDNGTSCGTSGFGGHGGGDQTGASPSRTVNGQAGSSGSSGGGGGGGGSSTGGLGGAGATGGQCGPVPAGSPGSSGVGGSGGAYVHGSCGKGGAGGDGYFGGGGGGANSVDTGSIDPGGGGGGGSSWTDATYVPTTGLVYERGVNSSIYGTVQLTYTPTSSSITVQPSNGQVGAAIPTQPAVSLQSGASAASGVVVTAALGTSPSPSGLQNTAALVGTLTATTNASGIAEFANLSINGPTGSYTLTFTASGYPSLTSSNFTLTVGTGTALKVSTQPTGGTSGDVVTGSPAVTVVDSGGNIVTSHPTTAVTVSSATGTIGGTTSADTTSGVATFTGATLAGLVSTNHTLSFAAAGLTSVTSSTFNISAGLASALSIQTQPVGGVTTGSPLGTVPVVKVVDSAGNTVTSSTATITATIASGSNNATLSADSAVASAGVATFTGLTVNVAGGSFTLSFSSPGLTSITSSAFTINRTSQTIAFTYGGGAKTYTSPDFNVSASASSSLLITFSTATPAVCGVSGDATVNAGVTSAVVSVDGVGTCTIHADQAGDDLYDAAPRQSITFNVTQASQSTLAISSTGSVTFGDTLTLATTGGSGTGAVSYALAGGTGTAQCTVNQSTGAMTFGAAGTCSVEATKAADTNYTTTTSATHLITVARAPQVLTFTSSVPSQPLPGDTYVLSVTSSAGLAATLTILQGLGTVCSISGSTVTFIATGTCEVSASNLGDGNHAAPAVAPSQVITVGALNQSITFSSLSNREFGDSNVVLNATASSGLSVAFTTLTPGVCSLSSGTVVVLTVGRCSITASQAGNGQWAAASPITRSFDVVATVPNQPTVLSVSGQSAGVTVAFATPGFAGGSPILGYEVRATPTGGGAAVSTSNCPSSPCAIEGLTNGTEYEITVAAINVVGTGLASAASPAVTPATSAMAVRNGSGVPGDETLTVSWTAPDDFGGGTFVKYELRLRTAGSAWPALSTHDVASAVSGSHTFTGLNNGTAYEVQIVTLTTANQAIIVGNTAVISSVPRTVPSAPRSLAVVDSGAGQITLSWAAPLSDGGSTITGYVVSIGAVNCGTVTIDPNTSAASCVVANLLSQATYPISIQAENAAGLGTSHTGTHTVAAYQLPQAPSTPFVPPVPVTPTVPSNPGGDNDEGSGGDTTPTQPGGPSAPPLPGTDDDRDGLPDPWTPNDDPTNVPGRPCSGCVQLFPGLQNGDGSLGTGGGETGRPGVTWSPPGSTPGTITVTTGTGTTVVIGGGVKTFTSLDGGFVVLPPGNVPIALSGLKPGSTVTAWLADNLSITGVVALERTASFLAPLPLELASGGTVAAGLADNLLIAAVVRPDGTLSLLTPLPPGLAPGTYTGRVDMVETDGGTRSILFGFEWVGPQGTLPVTGSGSPDLLVIVLWLFVAGCLVRAVSRRRFVI